MRVFNSTKEYEETGLSSCVALGFFDGLHEGHKEVIKSTVKEKDELSSVVLTFEKSPAAVLKNCEQELLLTNTKKAEMLEKMCVNSTIFVDFSSIMNMSAEQFVDEILDKELKAEKVFCGFNYHFGKSGKADTNTLKKLCEKRGIEVMVAKPVLFEDEAISSTRIRNAIKSGEIKKANAMLGYNFSITGVVEKGNEIGHTLSSPTVNIELEKGIIVPKFGVYKTKVTVEDFTYIGATNIGVHPTVGECSPICETYLFDFENKDIYGEKITVELLDFIREEKKFDSKEELKIQIEEDKELIFTMNN